MSTLVLKSGQSFGVLEKVFLSNPPKSLDELKAAVSRALGDTPSPEKLFLARMEGGGLVSLGEHDVSRLPQELFVFTHKLWRALDLGQSMAPEERREAIGKMEIAGSEKEFLMQLKEAQRLSLKDNEAVQAHRKRLAERAATFELKENPAIDQTGDCQFDAAADQLRLHGIRETKESVRETAVRWIEEHANDDGGHLHRWIEETTKKKFEEYVANMRKAKTWGDEVTLLAICEAYKVAIVLVISVEGGAWTRTHLPKGKTPNDELQQLWLGHESERHYWSLVAKLRPAEPADKGADFKRAKAESQVVTEEAIQECDRLLQEEESRAKEEGAYDMTEDEMLARGGGAWKKLWERECWTAESLDYALHELKNWVMGMMEANRLRKIVVIGMKGLVTERMRTLVQQKWPSIIYVAARSSEKAFAKLEEAVAGVVQVGKTRVAIRALEESFKDREEACRVLLLGYVAREHVLLLGKPGTGKTRLAGKLCSLCYGDIKEEGQEQGRWESWEELCEQVLGKSFAAKRTAKALEREGCKIERWEEYAESLETLQRMKILAGHAVDLRNAALQERAKRNERSFFGVLLTKYSIPEELLGPVDVRKLVGTGEFQRREQGFLGMAKIAFLDEIFKASTSILNSLLHVLDGTVAKQLRMVVGASNELPAPGMEAVADRFLMRVHVEDLKHMKQVQELVEQYFNTSRVPGDKRKEPLPPLSEYLPEIKGVSGKMLDNVVGKLDTLRKFVDSAARKKEGPPVSTRRWLKSLTMLCSAAKADGRDEVIPLDLYLLRYSLFGIIEGKYSAAAQVQADQAWQEQLDAALKTEIRVSLDAARKEEKPLPKGHVWIPQRVLLELLNQ